MKFIVIQNTYQHSKPVKVYHGLFDSCQSAYEWIDENVYYHGPFESFHYTYGIINVATGKEDRPFSKDYTRPKKG